MGRGDSASKRFSAREDFKSDCTQKLRRWISCTVLNGSSTFILGAEVEPGPDHLEENQQLTCDDITDATTPPTPARTERCWRIRLSTDPEGPVSRVFCQMALLPFFKIWSQIPRLCSPEKPNVMLHQCSVSVLTFTVSV